MCTCTGVYWYNTGSIIILANIVLRDVYLSTQAEKYMQMSCNYANLFLFLNVGHILNRLIAFGA